MSGAPIEMPGLDEKLLDSLIERGVPREDALWLVVQRGTEAADIAIREVLS